MQRSIGEILNEAEVVIPSGVYLLEVVDDDERHHFYLTDGREYSEFKKVAKAKVTMRDGAPYLSAKVYKDFFYSRHSFVPFNADSYKKDKK